MGLFSFLFKKTEEDVRMYLDDNLQERIDDCLRHKHCEMIENISDKIRRARTKEERMSIVSSLSSEDKWNVNQNFIGGIFGDIPSNIDRKIDISNIITLLSECKIELESAESCGDQDEAIKCKIRLDGIKKCIVKMCE